ncbi:MAG: hypothetical protein KDN22_02505 [Verrucomicrobiae bacterium]|nr:hypothetical protein [Verrucomicrobiae bacterium]
MTVDGEIECPSCHRISLVTDDLDACPRCECDLERLLQIALLAHAKIDQALRCLTTGGWEQALHHAEESRSLRHDARAARIAFLAATACDDLHAARKWDDALQQMRDK